MVNTKIRNSLFFTICFSIIFSNIPGGIQLNFIGGSIGNQLVLYPLLVGLIYTLYCKKKYKNIFIKKKEFVLFSFIYIITGLISIGLGLLQYPFYDEILNGPLTQIPKIPMMISFFSYLQIDFDRNNLILGWMFTRVIKGMLLSYLWTFCMGYIIFCWYKNTGEESFKILTRATLCGVCVILLYSVIELFYLGHVSAAGDILKIVNPYIHSIENDGTWWPPLLWGGQLRSVFAEPSYFGIYAAFAMPLLWYKLIETPMSFWKVFWGSILTVFTFCLFLTKARTAVVLFCGEVCLLFLALAYFRTKAFLKESIIIVACSLIAFIFANLFIMNVMPLPDKVTAHMTVIRSIEMYIGDNLQSINGKEKRSNRSRYSVMEADFRTGIEHPLLGVGIGLRDAYVGEKLADMDNKSDEMKRWIQAQKERGVMRAGIPVLGEYTSKFAETGMVGLLIYLFPAGYLIFLILKKIRKTNDIKIKEQAMFLLFSFLGTMAAGIGDNINITYCYWVLLGVGYAIYWPARVENE